MFDHISIGVRHIQTSRRFYDAALGALGYPIRQGDDTEFSYGGEDCVFAIAATDHPVPADLRSGLHFCFKAPSRSAVDAFHKTALAGGGKDHGAPGLRLNYGDSYYAAFAIDPDGYRIEAYCNRPE
ncbi:MAG TPA: VOC family protein [Aliidongia sp.]|uniref:VOC family protein n=1 Tax=Aliidongia sp. TaxID=1914230 RepID=UPI002DDCA6C8|nr:VOC family protein [Aliidongia sp.]HEV2676807.1 VOC family protein [Aliidongia sp.]